MDVKKSSQILSVTLNAREVLTLRNLLGGTNLDKTWEACAERGQTEEEFRNCCWSMMKDLEVKP